MLNFLPYIFLYFLILLDKCEKILEEEIEYCRFQWLKAFLIIMKSEVPLGRLFFILSLCCSKSESSILFSSKTQYYNMTMCYQLLSIFKSQISSTTIICESCSIWFFLLFSVHVVCVWHRMFPLFHFWDLKSYLYLKWCLWMVGYETVRIILDGWYGF